jgi:hypothetical protein
MRRVRVVQLEDSPQSPGDLTSLEGLTGLPPTGDEEGDTRGTAATMDFLRAQMHGRDDLARRESVHGARLNRRAAAGLIVRSPSAGSPMDSRASSRAGDADARAFSRAPSGEAAELHPLPEEPRGTRRVSLADARRQSFRASARRLSASGQIEELQAALSPSRPTRARAASGFA